MFCPGCGANNSTEQKFCRSCGMNLEQTAMSLLEQFPTEESANLQRNERLLERFGQIAFTGFGIVLITAILGIIYVIITKMILTGANFWSGILLVAFIVFASLTVGYVILNESIQDKRAKLSGRANTLESAADTGGLLNESSVQPASSVVESTTYRLDPETISKTREL